MIIYFVINTTIVAINWLIINCLVTNATYVVINWLITNTTYAVIKTWSPCWLPVCSVRAFISGLTGFAHAEISFVAIVEIDFLLYMLDIAELPMSDSSFCSFAFGLRLYWFLNWFSFPCSYETFSPTFFFRRCSGSVMLMKSLILLDGLPFDICLVLSR